MGKNNFSLNNTKEATAMKKKLSNNFTETEFTKSNTADRHGIDNSMDDIQYANACVLVSFCLQPLRNHIKKSIRITSGFRCDELNTILKGAKFSDHLYGFAADIESPGTSNMNLAKMILDLHLDFTQLILEFPNEDDPEAGWIHISYNPADLKKEILTALKVNGRTKYVEGLCFTEE